MLNELIGLRLQLPQSGVAAIFDHEAEAARAAKSWNRGSAINQDLGFGDLLEDLGPQVSRNGVSVQGVRLAVREIVENDEHRPEIGAVGAQDERIARDGI